jgi:hypothetical protein
MSADEVGDIRDKLSSNGERLARIEERLATLSGMVEKSLSSFGDLANRVTALEHLRTKLIVLASAIGAGVSFAWDFVKTRLGV